MLSEQMLNNMTLSELVAYSETFSDVPGRVAQALTEKLSELSSELEEAYETSDNMERELSDLESENDSLRAALNNIDIELDEEVPDLERIQRMINGAL